MKKDIVDVCGQIGRLNKSWKIRKIRRDKENLRSLSQGCFDLAWNLW